MNSQSTRSVTPPWPGIKESKSFTSYARLIAEARKPPNGATTDAKQPEDHGVELDRAHIM